VPRKPRVDEPDSFHHVSAVTSNREPLFRETTDRRDFIERLRRASAKHDWRCNAYCLMDTHFHLVVYTGAATLALGMSQLCSRYAQSFNWKYGRSGHLFRQRYSSRHITDDAQLLEAHRYVALNPVRAGLCADPVEWFWASYRAICGLEPAPDFLDVDAVLDLFSTDRNVARDAFRRLVLSGIEDRKAGV
jgi:REP-associated tyrosine transposase